MRKLLIFIMVMLAVPAMAQDDKDHDFKVAKNLEVFNRVYKNLDMLYVDTLDADQVIGYGIQQMLKSLDPYTEYYSEDDMKDLNTMLTGKYAGIGALIRYNQKIKRVVIDEPYKDMPAQKAGLKKGDIILSIDDSSAVNKNSEWVSSHLRGDAGTSFVLKIKRPSTGKEMKMKITRAAIQMPAVPFYGMVADSIGYINLRSFTEDCSKYVRRAFIDLKKQGATKLVFDLRNNGGGSESEAVNIVNMFIPAGKTVVSNRGRIERNNHDYKTTVEPIDSVMPMVVLVNSGTASASEITSGALQDFDRAVILGTRTYGKGLVQMTMDMPYNGGMKLTTNKYYIPSGRCIQAINYHHANGGYTEHVPDSLTKVFHTAGGREVRDGGGIKPDVEVTPDSLPNIAYYLAAGRDSTESMLTYEMDYIAKHPTIAKPDKFELTDAEYEEFKQLVLKNKFTYDPESEKALKDLEKLVKFEGYYEGAKQEFEALRKKLTHDVARDLDYSKTTMKQLLQNDIVAAYYYQAGSVENSLKYDKQMKEAIKLLRDMKRYNGILNK